MYPISFQPKKIQELLTCNRPHNQNSKQSTFELCELKCIVRHRAIWSDSVLSRLPVILKDNMPCSLLKVNFFQILEHVILPPVSLV